MMAASDTTELFKGEDWCQCSVKCSYHYQSSLKSQTKKARFIYLSVVTTSLPHLFSETYKTSAGSSLKCVAIKTPK